MWVSRRNIWDVSAAPSGVMRKWYLGIIIKRWQLFRQSMNFQALILFAIGFETYFIFLKNLHTYHSRFIPEGIAEVSQIFLRDTRVLSKLISYEEHYRRDSW
jgi:hypothetical protein